MKELRTWKEKVCITPSCSRDGKRLFIPAAGDKPWTVWDVDADRASEGFRVVGSLLWHFPDNKTAAVYRDKKLERIDLKTGKVVEALRQLATPGALQETYSADSRCLVVRFDDGSFVQYRVPFDGKEVSRFRLPQPDRSTPLNANLSHMSMTSISADGRFATLLTRRSLYVLRLPPLEQREPVKAEEANAIEPLHRFRGFARDDYLQFSPDGRYFLAVRGPSSRALARVYTQDGKLHLEQPATVACFSPDSTQIVTAGAPNTHLHVIDLVTKRPVRNWSIGMPVYNFHLAARGTRLSVVTQWRTQVWDWSTGTKLFDGIDPVGAAVPDGILDGSTGKQDAPVASTRRSLAPGKSRDQLRLLDATTGQVLGHLQLPEPVDTERSFLSSDGRYALVGGPTDSVYIFRLPDPPVARDKR